MSALRAPPSPQPAGSTGELGPSPALPHHTFYVRAPALLSPPCPGGVPSTLDPPLLDCAPITFTPVWPLFGSYPSFQVPSTIPSALCPRGTPPPPWPRLFPLPHPRAPPLTDHAPRSFWSAGGSPCWTHCGPACRWDPERCLLDSPCTRTSLGKAQMGECVWLLIPSSLAMTPLFPTGCCFSTWN